MTSSPRSWLLALPLGALCAGLLINGCDNTTTPPTGDGGTKQDSGTSADGGTQDSGTPVSQFIDCPTTNNEGCASYEDRTAAGASRTINFLTQPDGGQVYIPSCMQIRAGQTVTFSGNFGGHFLAQRCGPVDAGMQAMSGTQRNFTLTVTGDYGYYCEFHHLDKGMKGAIRVVP